MYCTTQVVSLRVTRHKTPCDRKRAQDTDTDLAIVKFFLPARLANGTKVINKRSNVFKCELAFKAGRAKLLERAKDLKRAAQKQRQTKPMNARSRSQCENRADAARLAASRAQPARAQRAAGSSKAASTAVEDEESDEEELWGESWEADIELVVSSDED